MAASHARIVVVDSAIIRFQSTQTGKEKSVNEARTKVRKERRPSSESDETENDHEKK